MKPTELFELEFFDAGEKRLIADAQAFGSARFVVVAFLEGCGDLPTLHEPLRAPADFGK